MKEICLPTNALAVNGTPPAAGDTIEISSLKGKVTRAEGANTYFQPTEVNGQPVTDEENTEGDHDEDTLAPTADSLRAAAGKHDEMMA